MIMEGLLKVRIPLLVRRLITLVPALAVLGVGFDPSRALVLSQVVLSFGIPFALYALLRVARDEQVLGPDRIGRGMSLLLGGISAVVICLNVVLLVDTISG